MILADRADPNGAVDGTKLNRRLIGIRRAVRIIADRIGQTDPS
jgi:hypothetical protein